MHRKMLLRENYVFLKHIYSLKSIVSRNVRKKYVNTLKSEPVIENTRNLLGGNV